MAQQVKVLVLGPNDLSALPRSQMERKTDVSELASSPHTRPAPNKQMNR